MKFEVKWVDVTKNLAEGKQPQAVLDRGTAECWVPSSSLLLPEIEWAVTARGDFVRVPVHAFRTRGLSHGSILATALELGILAAYSLQLRTGRPPAEVLFVLGSDITPHPDGYSCYAGMLFRF